MSSFWPLFVKELRALLPLWAPVMAVMYLHRLGGTGDFRELAVLAYIAGCLALGAQAIGHEHTHRTLAVLLTQPVSRHRLLIAKAAALTPLLLTLSTAAWYFVARDLEPQPPRALILLPAAAGLFVTPLITMLVRNQVGGIMLAAMFGGSTFVAAQLLAMKYSGLGPRAAEALALQTWQRTMYAVAAIAALLAWRTFMRLEAIEGSGRHLHLPALFRRTDSARSGSPVWVLIKKELRIQQLTFVLAGFFAAGEVVRFILERGGFIEANRGVPEVLVPVYFGAIALVAGSVASAEETNYGTVEAQLLVPVKAAQQWAIKAAVAVLLALVLGLGVPLLLLYSLWSGDVGGSVVHVAPSAVVIGWLTACGLYASSLSTSSVRALMLAGPFALGLQLIAVFVMRAPGQTTEAGIFTGVIAMAVLLIAMAGVNHLTADRAPKRALFQIAGTVALIVIAVPLLTIR